MREIYLAGGCFWGMEKAFRQLDGVLETSVGYANGTVDYPTYEQVCTDTTGHRETVKIIYDPSRVRLNTILRAFFICIDPTQKNRQGNDIGTQYQTGIYYSDEETGREVNAFVKEKKRMYPAFYTETAPLSCFWPAEDYHQNYLDVHPQGYCHVTTAEFDLIRQLNQEVKHD